MLVSSGDVLRNGLKERWSGRDDSEIFGFTVDG